MTLATSLAGAHWLAEPATQAVAGMLTEAGHHARFVGGCVRDGLIDPATRHRDIDIATTALPRDVLMIARQAGRRAIPTGLSHGTVTVIVDDRRFEITTLREDVDTDGRHATVRFTDSFQADAARRDLTFNAMSCDAQGRLFDYFGGRDDLSTGRVRFVGEPAQRIAEDYLRILRYFRFFARFGRTNPDSATLDAIAQAVDGMARLSRERIQHELRGLLLAPRAGKALPWMARLGINQAIFGGEIELARFARTDPCGDWVVALAALTRDRIEASTTAENLRLSAHDARLLATLTKAELPRCAYSAADARRCLYAHDERTCAGLLRLAYADGRLGDLPQAIALLNSTASPRFPLKGAHLIELGIEPGPAIGALLADVERWWIDGGCEAALPDCQAEARRRLALASR